MIGNFRECDQAIFQQYRLAQFSALISKVKFDYNVFNISRLLQTDISLSPFWQCHYHFDKPTIKETASLTKEFKNLILINAYIPFLFARGTLLDQFELKEEAIALLRDVKPEKNSMIQKWKSLGVIVENAFDSQSLIEQKNEFCNQRKCLECKIGQVILKYELIN